MNKVLCCVFTNWRHLSLVGHVYVRKFTRINDTVPTIGVKIQYMSRTQCHKYSALSLQILCLIPSVIMSFSKGLQYSLMWLYVFVCPLFKYFDTLTLAEMLRNSQVSLQITVEFLLVLFIIASSWNRLNSVYHGEW